MKRILVPTDFSNNAYSALFYATQLFQDQACHFYVLNTYKVQTPILTSRIDVSKGEQMYQRLKTISEEGLKKTYHAIVRDTKDLQHSFETISISKNLEETMQKTIKSKDIDLVVMGTKGVTGARKFILGSNAVNILQKIKKCPILVVPDEQDFKKPLNIAFPTDFKRFFLEKELIPLADIASLCESEIKIVHIHQEEKLDEIQTYNYNALKKHLKDFTYSFHAIANLDQKTKLIDDFIDHMNINMLVMVNYKHSLIEGVLREPVIKKIGFHPSVPFLVISDPS